MPSAVGGQREGVRLTHRYKGREDQTEGCRVSKLIYHDMYLIVIKSRSTYMYTGCQPSFKLNAQTGTTSAHELGSG